MRILKVAALAAAITATITACGGGHKIATYTIPPRLILAEFGKAAALVNFDTENAKGSLNELATRRFSERVLGASNSIEMLELGDSEPFLKASGERVFGPESAKAVATVHQVPVVFAGLLKVSNVKPSGGITGFGIPHIEATVQVDLQVALYSTKTGGTLWRSSATSTEKVGQLTMTGNIPSFSAKDPNAAYGRMVDNLIGVVTRDFYPTYERR